MGASEYVSLAVIVLVPVCNVSSYFAPAGTADLLRARFYQIALDLDLPLIDMEFLTAGFPGLTAIGGIGDEYGHMTAVGATSVGEKFAQAFMSTEFYTP